MRLMDCRVVLGAATVFENGNDWRVGIGVDRYDNQLEMSLMLFINGAVRFDPVLLY